MRGTKIITRECPLTDDDGAIMLSAGKYARQAVLAVFEMIGGVERMAEWADENPGEYYTKIFTKTITREVEQREADNSLDDVVRTIIDITPDRL